MAAIRLPRVILLLLVVLVILPLVTHYYLTKFVGDVAPSEVHQKNTHFDDLGSLKVTDLKIRIDEMMRIKSSVSSELRTLESKRRKLQSEIAALSQRLEELKAEYSHQQLEMERLRVSVEQAQFAQKEALEKNLPHIAAPLKILPESEDTQFLQSPLAQHRAQCRMYSCVDYSRCSVTSGFPVYFYHPDDYRLSWSQMHRFVKHSVTEALNMNIHITFDPAVACIYVVLVGQINKENYSKESLEEYLKNLAHWNGDGRNHLLLNFARDLNASDIFLNVDTGRAIVAQSHYSRSQFREGFDLVVPPLLGNSRGEVWNTMSTHCPARRKFLLSFVGEYREADSFDNEAEFGDKEATSQLNRRLKSLHGINESMLNGAIIETLRQIQSSEQEFLFQFSCKVREVGGLPNEWALCGAGSYEHILQESTFSLIISPSDPSLITTTHFQARLFQSLKAGAIPVILGDFVKLPFDEVVDWKKAVIIIPKARITELHFLLRSFRDADILSMRRQGRMLFERYMGTVQQVVNTILAVVRHRLQIPAAAAQEEPSISVFNTTFQPLKLENPIVVDNEPEENLGPMEPPFPSLPFQRNISYTFTQSYEMWNTLVDPFALYPYMPIDPILPSEAKFQGSSWGFRPIGQGAGGAGKEFSESLGGNVPREQFTIVMLTYEREAVLIDSLQRLKGLPHLNKVLVVWNSPRPPSADLRWPEIGVPIQVIKSRKNSLNNRFLPYDAIETEAILSLDDDAHLRHDEIVFGFRVWRESRDQIVGFPGRFHAWDLQHGGWLYNSNYSCELSMVLTGAAFIHKYYTYLYTYSMPQAIRDKVDEYTNCEDIAMNFLVSHITRKPPSKVTSRWTFRCPGCPVSLSEEESHFHERHKCINFFVQVYGYMPLLNTQFRADSVLFKTRIPHDKQKCFKFI